MLLTDNEKRDILKYIEAGKPLPDKYRFLLFDNDREVELTWNGKTNDVTNVVLPFQVIEQIDEPRSDNRIGMMTDLFDMSGRQIAGWTNKLIWGDNKLILSSLKNGPLRKAIEDQGGIKLIYIDPPFSAGIDYSIDVQIGDGQVDKLTKIPSVLEEFAYRNTWGNGGNTFIQMIYERVKLMRDLLADDGKFFLRIDYHWGHYIKLILDEIFGKEQFQSEIIVNRIKKNVTNQGNLSLPTSTDSFFVYFKSDKSSFRHINSKLSEEREGYWRRTDDSSGERRPRDRYVFGREFTPPPGKHFKFSQQTMERMITEGTLRFNERINRLEYYVKPTSLKVLDTNWSDLPGYSFTTGYPTENAESLLERVIDISTDVGDLVADFFNGSGTTAAVAEKMGRKWISTDLGKFSIHTTRKRMIGVQRELQKSGKDFRAFVILNMGRYERQHYVSTSDNLREEERQLQQQKKEQEFIELILSAYKAERIDTFQNMVGKKRDRLVAIGPIDYPVTIDFLDQVVKECINKGITKVDVLGFDWEMGLDADQFKNQEIDIQLKVIPREVFDKRAVEKGQVKFYDVAYIEIKPIIKGHVQDRTISVEITDFSVFYTQDDPDIVSEGLKPGGSKIILENGQVVKISKDKTTNVISKEVLTRKWSDWIDYWAVDYDFSSRKEIIKIVKDGIEKEVWTGDYIFDNEWQSFRTKKDRNLELVSVAKPVDPGEYKVAVKVVDIFGNDTTKVIDIKI